jgi:hypothetical protein
MEKRLDKGQFKKQTKKEAESQTRFWRTKTRDERLQAAYHLSLRAFGFDPEHPPKMDKSYFRKRKFS